MKSAVSANEQLNAVCIRAHDEYDDRLLLVQQRSIARVICLPIRGLRAIILVIILIAYQCVSWLAVCRVSRNELDLF